MKYIIIVIICRNMVYIMI